MQKYWRDRAYELHRTIKAQGINISRDNPAEMIGAFLTYFTRQELLESYHGEELMDLLQGVSGPKPYVILDDDLGVKRIAQLLNIPVNQASDIAQLFMIAFEELAPGHVFRSEGDFVSDLILPRIKRTLETSSEFAYECSAIGSERIRVGLDHWEDSARFYEYLPDHVPKDHVEIEKLRKLRDDKSDTWQFHGMFDLTPLDENGKAMVTDKYPSWVSVRINFEKLDRAILAGGSYYAEVNGTICKAWSGGGPFDSIANPKLMVMIDF